jgi:hypothetical protein
MTRYAASTIISLSHSIIDIEKLVRANGMTGFVQGVAEDRIVIAFANQEGRQVRFVVPVKPASQDLLGEMRAAAAASRSTRPTSQEQAWDQHRRQLGRALLLTIKAKIECIAAGIETFEDAFMSQLALPDGRTVGQMVKAEVQQLYDAGRAPPRLLPDYSGEKS